MAEPSEVSDDSADDTPPCAHCGKEGAGELTCSRCKSASYCSKECQVADWKRGHKLSCQQSAFERELRAEMTKLGISSVGLREKAEFVEAIEDRRSENLAIMLEQHEQATLDPDDDTMPDLSHSDEDVAWAVGRLRAAAFAFAQSWWSPRQRHRFARSTASHAAGPKPHDRPKARYVFICAGREEAEDWLRDIRAVLRAVEEPRP